MAIVIPAEEMKDDTVTVRDDGVIEVRSSREVAAAKSRLAKEESAPWLAISPMAINAIRSHPSEGLCVVGLSNDRLVIRASAAHVMECWHEGRRRWIQAMGKS